MVSSLDWVGEGPLYKLNNLKIPETKAHWFVSHIIRNGSWYLNDSENLIPPHIKTLILSYPLSNSMEEEDFIR